MAIPRNRIFDRTKPVTCHCVSRCVRRISLLAPEERRRALHDRLTQLVRFFAIDVLEWSLLTNHFHLVASTHPDLAAHWSDQEVATRWRTLSPDYVWRRRNRIDRSLPAQPEEIAAAVADPDLIARWRCNLADLSIFHKFLKQKIARAINLQDDVTGHCFEGRFKSIVALDEEAVIAHMVYVALNPVRASMTDSLEDYEFSSVADRVKELKTRIRNGEFADEAGAAIRKLRELELRPAISCDPGENIRKAKRLPDGRPNPWFGGRVPSIVEGAMLTAYLTRVDTIGRIGDGTKRGVINPSISSPLADMGLDLLHFAPQSGAGPPDFPPPLTLAAVEGAMSRGPENPMGNFSGCRRALARAAHATGRMWILGIASFMPGDPRRRVPASDDEECDRLG